MRSAQPMIGLPFYRHIPKPTSEQRSQQPPPSGYYSGVWYPSPTYPFPTLPLPERRAVVSSFAFGTDPIMVCSKSTTRRPTHPPGSLSFGSSYMLYLSHDSAPRPAGRGTNHPPAVPKMIVPSKSLAGTGRCMVNVWSTYAPLLARCVQRCSILHIVVVYICATYCILYAHYAANCVRGPLGGCCARITEYYIGRRCSEKRSKRVRCTVYSTQKRARVGACWHTMLPDHHCCCSTAGRGVSRMRRMRPGESTQHSTLEHAPSSQDASLGNETIKLHQTRGRGSMHRCTVISKANRPGPMPRICTYAACLPPIATLHWIGSLR